MSDKGRYYSSTTTNDYYVNNRRQKYYYFIFIIIILPKVVLIFQANKIMPRDVQMDVWNQRRIQGSKMRRRHGVGGGAPVNFRRGRIYHNFPEVGLLILFH